MRSLKHLKIRSEWTLQEKEGSIQQRQVEEPSKQDQ